MKNEIKADEVLMNGIIAIRMANDVKNSSPGDRGENTNRSQTKRE